MTIAIDIDGTYTADPGLWRQFIAAALLREHTVIFVTGRTKDIEPDEKERLKLPAIPLIYSRRDFKEKAVLEAGYKVNIWIDDMPGVIQETKLLPGCRNEEL